MSRIVILAFLLIACQDDAPPASPVEALCTEPDVQTAIAYADFYWDDLRTGDPELFARALAICTRQCPHSSACAPVLSVARWYQSPSLRPQATTEATKPQRRHQ